MADPLPTTDESKQSHVGGPAALPAAVRDLASIPDPPADDVNHPRREFKKLAKRYALSGLSQRQIADILEISPNTLTKHYAKELKYGDVANANVARTLYQKALQGDTTAAIFWLKARFGWRDRDATQILNAPVTVSADAKSVEMALLNALEGTGKSKRAPVTIEQLDNQ